MPFFKILTIDLRENNETKNVKINAKKHSKNPRPEKDKALPHSKNSNKKPPTMIGMLSKKLYSADSSSPFPQNVNAEIVVPDLESPGKTANPWATPTTIAEPKPMPPLFKTAELFLNLWLKSKINPVTTKQTP